MSFLLFDLLYLPYLPSCKYSLGVCFFLILLLALVMPFNISLTNSRKKVGMELLLKMYILQRCLQTQYNNIEQAVTENGGHCKACCSLFLSQSTFFGSCLPTVCTATITSRGQKVLPPFSKLLIKSILVFLVRQTEENLVSSEILFLFDYPTWEVIHKWLSRKPAFCEGSK